MRLSLIAVILVFLCACGTPKEKQQDPAQQNIPEALQEERKSSELSFKSRGKGEENLVEELYEEKKDSDSSLQELEKRMGATYEMKNDSLQSFNFFNAKNEAFYRDAVRYTGRIRDSLLKKETENYFMTAAAGYKNRIAGLSALADAIENKSLSLADRYSLLKLFVSLSMMKQYQQNNFPSGKPLENVLNTQDRLINAIDAVVQKNK
jgi:hypothetical protein